MKKTRTITIDGPAGAGKTTMAKYLADVLKGFAYVDTGAFYRLLAFVATANGFGRDVLENHEREYLNLCPKYAEDEGFGAVALHDRNGNLIQAMCLSGGRFLPDDVLRTQEISDMSSIVSTHPAIRRMANDMIRNYARGQDIIIEGRDTGSVLFPDADMKFYLYADAAARAKRRMKDMTASEKNTESIQDLVAAITAIRERDLRDSTRSISPLKVPDGCFWLDTSELDMDAVKRILKNAAEGMIDPRSVPAI